MNKKFTQLSLFIIILLVIVFSISVVYKFHRSTVNIIPDNTVGIEKDSINLNKTATTTLNCPDGLVQTTLVGVDGHNKMFCAPPSSKEYLVGNGTETYSFLGYYSSYKKQIYDGYSDHSTLGTTTCPAITIVNGDTNFIQAFKKLITDGNTVNRFNNNKELLLNINLADLSLEVQGLLKDSSEKTPINIKAKVRESREGEANYCESFIKIISVN